MPNIIMSMSSASVAVPANQSIAVFTQATAQVYQVVNSVPTLLGTVTTQQQTFGPFASGATISITSGALPVAYGVGTNPVIQELIANRIQRAPIAINTASAIPADALARGMISSNSLLGISCTLPTGAALDLISDFRMDDAFDWCVMVIGLFGFTVAASTGHTIVGNATIASGTSGNFRTRKTGAATYVTYRIS